MENKPEVLAVGDLVEVFSGVYKGAKGKITDAPDGTSAVRIESPEGLVYALRGTMRKVVTRPKPSPRKR